MAYFIKESNQDNTNLIHAFNKDLEEHKINIEVLDLRTISPLDKKAIIKVDDGWTKNH